MNEEEKKVLSIVRSLIISSNPQDGLCLRKILDDFQEYEGKRLPLFEHKTALEFLQASGEFVIKNVGAEYVVYAKTSPKSKHISKFVAEQNKPRAYRCRPSVQIRLLQTNHNVNTRHFQRTSQEVSKPAALHRGTTTVYSFEELKAKQKEKLLESNQAPNQPIHCGHKNGEIVEETGDKIAKTPDNEVKEITSTDHGISVEYQQIDNLELPWADEYWSLLITCCTSVTEIWGKLAGKHCLFDSSAIKFQEDVLNNKRRATVFNVGQIYVTLTQDTAYRVRIDNIDYANNQILCFFVDEGDKKWLDVNEIYDCRSIFTKYPAQAICFSLRGLEDFPINNGIARKCLQSTLLGRTLTGQIFTTKEDFHSRNECNGTKAAIQVGFLDTSGGDFIDLHREIIKQMYDDIGVQELMTMKLTPVKISHITDNGDIFCQLEQSSVDYVKKLITEFIRKVSNNPFRASDKVVPLSGESLFVVHDSETNNLYRAKVISEVDDGSIMFFIDYGHSKLIPSSKMYLIESELMEEEIYRYPPQAVRTKLSGVSKFDVESSVSRLRSHFMLKRNAYVRRMQSNTIVPEIKLYFDAESFMVCVNDSFELEGERSRIIGSRSSTISDTTDFICNSHSIVDRTFVETVLRTPKIETFLPPKLNSSFEILIVNTESPSNFVIKPTEYIPQWQKQMKALQSYCKETSPPMTLDMIKEGEPYACLKSNGYWYRAIVKFHRTKLYAFFCDIADIDSITDLNKIKYLPKEYHTIPKLAMTARLFGVEPVNGTWELDDKIQFHRITKGHKFMAEVIKVFQGKSEENSVLEIVLKHNDDVINELFVASGRAIRSNIMS